MQKADKKAQHSPSASWYTLRLWQADVGKNGEKGGEQSGSAWENKLPNLEQLKRRPERVEGVRRHEKFTSWMTHQLPL